MQECPKAHWAAGEEIQTHHSCITSISYYNTSSRLPWIHVPWHAHFFLNAMLAFIGQARNEWERRAADRWASRGWHWALACKLKMLLHQSDSALSEPHIMQGAAAEASINFAWGLLSSCRRCESLMEVVVHFKGCLWCFLVSRISLGSLGCFCCWVFLQLQTLLCSFGCLLLKVADGRIKTVLETFGNTLLLFHKCLLCIFYYLHQYFQSNINKIHYKNRKTIMM